MNTKEYSPRRDKQNLWAIFVLAIASFTIYANSLENSFVLDDLHSICNNIYVKDLSHIQLLFKGSYTSIPDVPKGMFRPLLLLSFAFNYFFSGLNTLGYHIINILLHFLNGTLLYLLLHSLKKDMPCGLALLISLLFISHPINTEAVTYITCRSDLLVTFLILSAFLSYLKKKPHLAAFLYLLGLLTKETALIFPFLTGAYDYICFPDNINYNQKKAKKKQTAFYLIIIFSTLLYWIYRGTIFHQNAKDIILSSANSPVRDFKTNFLIQTVVSLFYLRLFIWPHPLNLHHIIPSYNSFFEPAVLTCAIFILLAFILIFALKKIWPLISFGISWYLIGLIPKFYGVLNFPAMEHHFYLAGIGIYLILTDGLEKVYLKYRRYFIYITCGLISLFGVIAWLRNFEWKDNLTLYRVAVKRDPDSAVAHNNLGIEYSRIGLFEIAEEEYKKALSLSDSIDVNINCRLNLARIYANKKRFADSIEEVRKALTIKSNYSTIYHTYGAIYFEMGEKEKAEEIWNNGLIFNPNESGILRNLGILYLEKEEIHQAEKYLLSAIKSSPDNFIAYFDLGRAFEKEKDAASAINYYQKSIALNPAHELSHYGLGRLYARELNPRALYHLKEAVRLSPLLAEAQNDLAVLYASMEPPKLDLAKEHARKALSLGYPVEKEFLKLIGIEEERRGER